MRLIILASVSADDRRREKEGGRKSGERKKWSEKKRERKRGTRSFGRWRSDATWNSEFNGGDDDDDDESIRSVYTVGGNTADPTALYYTHTKMFIFIYKPDNVCV